MITFGIVLLVIGLLLGIGLLTSVGVVLLVIGLALMFLGRTGRPVGGRNHYY